MELPNDQANQAREIMQKLHAAGCVPPGPQVRPPGVDVETNMKEAEKMSPNLWAFYKHVNNLGPWDYKHNHHEYQDFGNFHYGAVGEAFGVPEQILLREAGRNQLHHNPDPKFGQPYVGLHPIQIGKPPYGDDPKDQEMIKQGIDFGRKSKAQCFCK